MNIIKQILNLVKTKKKQVTCEHSEHCPIHLAYLGEYGKDSKEIKYCKQPNVQYCKKYNLINQEEWNKRTDEEKIKIVKEMELLKIIKKR